MKRTKERVSYASERSTSDMLIVIENAHFATGNYRYNCTVKVLHCPLLDMSGSATAGANDQWLPTLSISVTYILTSNVGDVKLPGPTVDVLGLFAGGQYLPLTTVLCLLMVRCRYEKVRNR